MIRMPLTSRHGISDVASVNSSGSLVAMSPSRPTTASPARRSGRSASQRSLPSMTSRLPHQPPRPGRPEGRRFLWSQVDGLAADVDVTRLEPAARDYINADSQEFLKVLEQADLVEKRRAWLEVDKQVNVTSVSRLASGDRPEDRDPARPALARDAKDLGAALAQRFHGQDVAGHHRSVSPRA